eukprot:6413713-Lingulodinium_polyedra.AAC.1
MAAHVFLALAALIARLVSAIAGSRVRTEAELPYFSSPFRTYPIGNHAEMAELPSSLPATRRQAYMAA